MRLRFIKPALFVLLGIFIGMYFLRCGNDTGTGSDFDATKYYTKDQIDTMMAQYYQQSEIDNLISKNKNTIISTLGVPLGGQKKYILYDNEFQDDRWANIVAPINGTIKNLTVRADKITNVGAVVEVIICVNKIETSLKLTLTSADTDLIKTNSFDSVSINQGDLMLIKIRETTGIDPGNVLYISYLFDTEI